VASGFSFPRAHQIVKRLHFFPLAAAGRPVMLALSQYVVAGVRRAEGH
jgi:hypothetical protein